MIDLTTTIEIDASAETVWKNLIDLARFSEWNPFIREGSGTPAVGATLRVQVKSKIPVPLVFRPKVVVCEKNRELRWRGRFVSRWLGAGDHTFTIEPSPSGRVRLVQREIFTGLLPTLFQELLVREARNGFLAMNEALKERSERPPGVDGAKLASPAPRPTVRA